MVLDTIPVTKQQHLEYVQAPVYLTLPYLTSPRLASCLSTSHAVTSPPKSTQTKPCVALRRYAENAFLGRFVATWLYAQSQKPAKEAAAILRGIGRVAGS